MARKVGVGVVGAGHAAEFALAAFARHPAVELCALADPNAERARGLADEFGIPRVFATAERLYQERDVDAVYIASPNAFHAEQARLGLESGKHVLLEKPFALSHVEAARVVETARHRGLVFSLAMNQRFGAETQRARALLSTGRLGRIYHARAYWLRRAGIPRLGTWFGQRSVAGGGALFDIGVHLLDLTCHLLDDFAPTVVTGVTHSTFGARGLGQGSWGKSEPSGSAFDVEDFAAASLRFAGGRSASLEVSWAIHQAESERRDVELFGDEGGVSLHPPRLFRFGVEEADNELAELQTEPLQFGHQSPQHNFVNHLLGSEELLVTAQQAWAVQRVLDAIYESAASGRDVRLDWS
jgi:predicted dehydrogenase